MANERILVVEDNNIVLQDIRTRLEKLGYSVVGTARSGIEAIEKAAVAKPDLALMDIKLRGEMDGVEAAAVIRRCNDIPIVYLTAYTDANTLDRAKLTEPFGYILKPFDESALHTNIQIALFKHEMERNLRESERWLSTALKCIGDATVCTDAQGRVRLLNQVAEELTGRSQAEAMGKPWSDVIEVVDEATRSPLGVSPSELAADERRLRAGELLLIDKRGAEIPIELTAKPIIDGDRTLGMVLVFRDITERKVASEALEQNHQLLHLVLEGVQDIIFLKNLDGRFILMNRAGCGLVQRPESEILGKLDSDLYGPGTASLMSQAHERAIETGDVQTFECVMTSDGTERTFLVSEVVCRTRTGSLLGVVGIGRDITEVTVDRMPIHQKQKLAVTGRAVGELAHEVNRSLTGIRESFLAIKEVATQQEGYDRQVGEIEEELAHIAGIARQMSELYWTSRSRHVRG